ncbi:uncharacterized protein J5F26_005411 [Ciconia maguari]
MLLQPRISHVIRISVLDLNRSPSESRSWVMEKHWLPGRRTRKNAEEGSRVSMFDASGSTPLLSSCCQWCGNLEWNTTVNLHVLYASVTGIRRALAEEAERDLA